MSKVLFLCAFFYFAILGNAFAQLEIVPKAALEKATAYYNTYYEKIRNKDYITIIDMNQHNTEKRMYVVNMKTQEVSTYLTAHGKGSDPAHTGYATRFSNRPGSSMSSLGIYLTAGEYEGGHGRSMRLQGVEASNSNAYSRAIVMHSAWYVDSDLNPIGRSFGCPAVEERYIDKLIDQLKGGSVFLIWAGK